jgi:hypothetical protein
MILNTPTSSEALILLVHPLNKDTRENDHYYTVVDNLWDTAFQQSPADFPICGWACAIFEALLFPPYDG